jgi:hypothetical protein
MSSTDHAYDCAKHFFFIVDCTVHRVKFETANEIDDMMCKLLETVLGGLPKKWADCIFSNMQLLG